MILVLSGFREAEIDCVGHTVGEIRSNLKDILHLSNEICSINGKIVNDAWIIDDEVKQIEFLKKGSKANSDIYILKKYAGYNLVGLETAGYFKNIDDASQWLAKEWPDHKVTKEGINTDRKEPGVTIEICKLLEYDKNGVKK